FRDGRPARRCRTQPASRRASGIRAVAGGDRRGEVLRATADGTRAVVDDLEQAGVIAVIRIADGSDLRAVADALIEGGVRALEVTMTVPGAVSLIVMLASSVPASVIVGAGTVLDVET